jgi:hypothetical protein
MTRQAGLLLAVTAGVSAGCMATRRAQFERNCPGCFAAGARNEIR